MILIYEEEVDATYGVISYDANKVSEWLHSQFRVVEKLHQDVIVGFDWFQSINPKVDRVNYRVTLKNGFVATGVPVYCNIKIELYSLKMLMHLLHINKLENSWLTFIWYIFSP